MKTRRPDPLRPGLSALRMRRGLYERFLRAAASLDWKRGFTRIVVGVSGGCDSVALLHLCSAAGFEVTAAHLNHRLRGRESDRDERFVRDLCRRWGIRTVVGCESVMARAVRHKLSIEEAARIARYQFFHRVALGWKTVWVAVAHHEHDQAETVLLKIFRGCRRETLGGMEVSRPFPLLHWVKPDRLAERRPGRLKLARPLLDAPRGEIVAYVKQNRLPFREDSSNRDLKNPRNWIRHRLLPLIGRRLNRNVVRTLARMGVP